MARNEILAGQDFEDFYWKEILNPGIWKSKKEIGANEFRLYIPLDILEDFRTRYGSGYGKYWLADVDGAGNIIRANPNFRGPWLRNRQSRDGGKQKRNPDDYILQWEV